MAQHRSPHPHGVGQSGYTAGRREHDPALTHDIQVQNAAFPRGQGEEQLQDELEHDERFVGRGGTLPAEEAPDPAAATAADLEADTGKKPT
jgi:hypothetical protein